MELFEETSQEKPPDTDEITSMKESLKVLKEIHLLQGLLRFSPSANGAYIAYCAPDYFILPALAEHFTARFGETPWAIIDEKRNLCLVKEKGGEARIIDLPPSFFCVDETSKAFDKKGNSAKDRDSWEDLWRLYHKSINNEARNNERLQRQFIPKRYHKYLCEMDS